MRSIFFTLVYLLSQGTNLLAQANNQPLSSGPKPRIGITVLTDGKPTNQQRGVKINTKEFRFKALLDTKSTHFFNDFQPELLIKNTEVVLARNGRKLAQTNNTTGRLVTDLVETAESADHIIFKFTLVAQRKDGVLVPLSEEPTYNFPIIK